MIIILEGSEDQIQRLKDILPQNYNMPKINTDFTALREQKEILINMIQDWGESCDPSQKADAKQAEGLLFLIDSMQDYTVDQLKIEEAEVYSSTEK